MSEPVQIILQGIDNNARKTLDDGVRGIEKLSHAAAQASHSTEELARHSEGLGHSLKEATLRVGEFFSALILERGVEKLFEVLKDGFKEVAGEAIKFHRTVEDTTLGLAAIVRTVRPDIFKDFNSALAGSAKIMDQLHEKSIETQVSIEDLSGVFQQIIGPLSQSRASLKEVIELTGVIAQATKLLPAAERNLAEARALVTGNISERSRLANLLQLTPDQVQSARSTGALTDLLRRKLKDLAEAGLLAQTTFSGALNAIKTILEIDLGEVTIAVFQKVRGALNTVVEFLKGDTFKNVVEHTKEVMNTLADFVGVVIDKVSKGESIQILSLTIRAALEQVSDASLTVFNAMIANLESGIKKLFTVDALADIGNLVIALGQLVAQVLTTFENALAAAAFGGLGGIRDGINKLSDATGGILARVSPLAIVLNAVLPKQISVAETFDKLQAKTALSNDRTGLFLSGLIEMAQKRLKIAKEIDEAGSGEADSANEVVSATVQLNKLLAEQAAKRKALAAGSGTGDTTEGDPLAVPAPKIDDLISIAADRHRVELEFQSDLILTNRLVQESSDGSLSREQAFVIETQAGDQLVRRYDQLIDRAKTFLALHPEDLGALQALVELETARANVPSVKQLELQPGQFSQRRDIPFSKRFDVFNQRDPKTGAGDPSIGAGLENFTAKLGTQAERVAKILQGTLGNAIDGISSGITGLINGTQSWGEAMRNTGNAIVNALVKIGVEQVAQFVLSKALSAAAKSFGVTDAATTAAAYAPAAAAASSATFGASSAVGVVITLAAIAAIIAALTAFDRGGYTGDGGKYQPAGVVHSGEYVLHAEATKRIGVENLNRLMSGQANWQSFADGGYAQTRFGAFPSYASGGHVSDFVPSINIPPPQIVVFDDKAKMREFLMSHPGAQIVFDSVQRRRMDLGLSS